MNMTWAWELRVNGREEQVIRSEGTWTTAEAALADGKADCIRNRRKGQIKFLATVPVAPIVPRWTYTGGQVG